MTRPSIKSICSTFQEYVKHSQALREKFVAIGYDENHNLN